MAAAHSPHFTTVDQYIGSFPEDVQLILREVRRRILAMVPQAGETISYQIPAITLGGRRLVFFAAWKHHLSVYPLPADKELHRDLAPYLAGKGTAKFPLGEPVPYDLIERLVALLLQQRQGQPG